MNSLPLLYLACILAGFALIKVPTSAIVTAGISSFLGILGGLTVIVFALALLYLGIRSLVGK